MSYWNNRRICTANGGLPPILKEQQYYDSIMNNDKQNDLCVKYAKGCSGDRIIELNQIYTNLQVILDSSIDNITMLKRFK